MAQAQKRPDDRPDTSTNDRHGPYGVDSAFGEAGETGRDGHAAVGRPVSELLADDAGPSSPFGTTSLPMPPQDVDYELPDDEPPQIDPVRDF